MCRKYNRYNHDYDIYMNVYKMRNESGEMVYTSIYIFKSLLKHTKINSTEVSCLNLVGRLAAHRQICVYSSQMILRHSVSILFN